MLLTTKAQYSSARSFQVISCGAKAFFSIWDKENARTSQSGLDTVSTCGSQGSFCAMAVRFPSSADSGRGFQRAFELLASSAPESEAELLELCKKALRDTQGGPPPAKRPRPQGVGASAWCAGEPLPVHSLGARLSPATPITHAHHGVSAVAADATSPHVGPPLSSPASAPLSAAGVPVPKGGTQQRLMQAMKGGFKAGRPEKLKRRPGR